MLVSVQGGDEGRADPNKFEGNPSPELLNYKILNLQNKDSRILIRKSAYQIASQLMQPCVSCSNRELSEYSAFPSKP